MLADGNIEFAELAPPVNNQIHSSKRFFRDYFNQIESSIAMVTQTIVEQAERGGSR